IGSSRAVVIVGVLENCLGKSECQTTRLLSSDVPEMLQLRFLGSYLELGQWAAKAVQVPSKGVPEYPLDTGAGLGLSLQVPSLSIGHLL
ncbi:hypothetical protein BD769DRAFT_1353490, partial [Suillus cothurnatus]